MKNKSFVLVGRDITDNTTKPLTCVNLYTLKHPFSIRDPFSSVYLNATINLTFDPMVIEQELDVLTTLNTIYKKYLSGFSPPVCDFCSNVCTNFP